MWQTILNFLLTTVLTGIAGIMITYLFKYLRNKFGDVMKYVPSIVKMVVNYFNANPELKKDVNNILMFFKEQIIKTCPWITEEQIIFIFNSIIGDIAKELGIDIKEFTKLSCLKAKVFNNYTLAMLDGEGKGLFE